MSYMIVGTSYSSPDGHVFLKCKRCKQEFYVVEGARYRKLVNFCPYCGQERVQKRHNEADYGNWENETLNG